MRVLDLGAGDNPDERATETVDLYTDADHQFDLEEPWQLEDNSVDFLIANHVLEHLDAGHFFDEAGRVLVDGGWLEITVPVGRDAKADPDHSFANNWEYWTPEMYCREKRTADSRPWDAQTEFVLHEREIDLWLLGPLSPFSSLFNILAQVWPAWGVHRCGAGELTAIYQRVAR